jgi:hypothetical protein
MLKLKKINNVENIKNESDFYIRIKIIFGNCKCNTPLYYWSTSGSQKTLLEIGLKESIGDSTGAIYEITVISMPKSQSLYRIKNSSNLIKKIGLPVFEIPKQINAYSLRESKDFEFYTDQQNTFILFSQNEIVLNIVNESIMFGFDKDNFLCSITMAGMALNKDEFLEEIK